MADIKLLNKVGIFALIVSLSGAVIPDTASAGSIELSVAFSFNRSNYGNQDFSWNRRWGLSAGYNFTDTSGIEFSFQDILDRTQIAGYEDTTFHDKIYSANWVQALTGKNFPVQPYVKGGFGQLNRNATGTYAGGGSPAVKVDSLTVLLGAGLRIYLSKSFAIRTEATSYIAGGSVRKWQDNIGVTVGTSYYF